VFIGYRREIKSKAQATESRFGRGKRNRELLQDTTTGVAYKLVDADGYGDVALLTMLAIGTSQQVRTVVSKPTKIVD
jgi:hypothetical protein